MKGVLHKIRRNLSRRYHELNPGSRRKAYLWEHEQGPEFFKTLGLRPGDSLLDFGCGPGRYAVAAARLVGNKGRIFALDNNPEIAAKLRKRAAAIGLTQLRVVEQVADIPADAACRLVLLYDMLHFHTPAERTAIYRKVSDILHCNGRLSIHPKHLRDDPEPARYFASLGPDDLLTEIESAGFQLDEKLAIRVWHAHNSKQGIIWNFQKTTLTQCAKNPVR